MQVIFVAIVNTILQWRYKIRKYKNTKNFKLIFLGTRIDRLKVKLTKIPIERYSLYDNHLSCCNIFIITQILSLFCISNGMPNRISKLCIHFQNKYQTREKQFCYFSSNFKYHGRVLSNNKKPNISICWTNITNGV